MARLLINILVVIVVLFLFSIIGAVIFPGLPSTAASVDTYTHNLLLLLIPGVVMALVGHVLGRGIKGIKSNLEALGLAFASAFILGGVLALFSLLNFAYSARVNFTWLGTTWYGPLFTIFLVGAPLMLAFLA
jgi:hypothetical protein